MQFVPFEAGIEVSGESLGAIVDGFRLFPSIAHKYLTKFGVCKVGPSQQAVLDRTAWYPLDRWLETFKAMTLEVGGGVLYNVGLRIPENAKFPPHINDVHSAIQSVDVAYHMNHRKNGKVMFDPATGKMLEGIGHYGYAPVPNESKIVAVCENPYPCEFDRGILTAIASKFNGKAKTDHDDKAPCRQRGAESCTYVVRF